MLCPMYFKFKYVDKQKMIPHFAVQDNFQREAQHLVYYFFNKLIDGEPPSVGWMLRTWGELLYKGRDKSTILFNPVKTRHDRKRTVVKGAELAVAIYNRFTKERSRPLVVNHRYTLAVLDTEIEGRVDVIRQVETIDRPITELIVLSCDGGFDLKWPVNPLTIWSQVVIANQILNVPLDQVSVYHIIHDNYVPAPVINDPARIYPMFMAVLRGIREEVFYPAIGRSCVGCGFQHLCKQQKWKYSIPKEVAKSHEV